MRRGLVQLRAKVDTKHAALHGSSSSSAAKRRKRKKKRKRKAPHGTLLRRARAVRS